MPTVTFEFTLPTLEDTASLGLALGRALLPGEHVALVGGMGAGKTTLARSIAEGFGVVALHEVASPTYAYAHEYEAGQRKLVHVDFYRLSTVEDALALGLDELLQDARAPAVVEWADLFAHLLGADALWLMLTRQPGASERTARLRVPEGRSAALRRVLPDWVGPAA